MPLFIIRKLDLREIKDTNITLQLTYRSIKCLVGMIQNILIKMKSFIIPVDFIVSYMKEDMHMPIILGRPFLATTATLIDVQEGKLVFSIYIPFYSRCLICYYSICMLLVLDFLQHEQYSTSKVLVFFP